MTQRAPTWQTATRLAPNRLTGYRSTARVHVLDTRTRVTSPAWRSLHRPNTMRAHLRTHPRDVASFDGPSIHRRRASGAARGPRHADSSRDLARHACMRCARLRTRSQPRLARRGSDGGHRGGQADRHLDMIGAGGSNARLITCACRGRFRRRREHEERTSARATVSAPLRCCGICRALRAM